MKANGLIMVGDWAEVINSDHLKYVKVRNILDNSIITEEGEYESEEIKLENIKPIPLTIGIIEKNGFEGTPTDDLFIEKNLWDKYAIELFPSEGSWLLRITDKTNKYICGCNRINLYISYIYELQHALKQCNIEKEIEL